uniref:Uncharacterized protein n=1 Tax=Triticum urartu TaxID=4572 RepID=A0A8R7PQ56_TRIUA
LLSTHLLGFPSFRPPLPPPAPDAATIPAQSGDPRRSSGLGWSSSSSGGGPQRHQRLSRQSNVGRTGVRLRPALAAPPVHPTNKRGLRRRCTTEVHTLFPVGRRWCSCSNQIPPPRSQVRFKFAFHQSDDKYSCLVDGGDQGVELVHAYNLLAQRHTRVLMATMMTKQADFYFRHTVG